MNTTTFRMGALLVLVQGIVSFSFVWQWAHQHTNGPPPGHGPPGARPAADCGDDVGCGVPALPFLAEPRLPAAAAAAPAAPPAARPAAPPAAPPAAAALYVNAENQAAAARVRASAGDPRAHESIFVSMAAYKDPECAPTLERAYRRAAVPDRVFFGIYQQHNGTHQTMQDGECVDTLKPTLNCDGSPEAHALCARFGQVRVTKIDWMDTQGPTWARSESEKLWRNETFVLSFDSHTNFIKGESRYYCYSTVLLRLRVLRRLLLLLLRLRYYYSYSYSYSYSYCYYP